MQDLTRSCWHQRLYLVGEIQVAERPGKILSEHVRAEIMRIQTRAQAEKNTAEHENLYGEYGQDLAMNKIQDAKERENSISSPKKQVIG